MLVWNGGLKLIIMRSKRLDSVYKKERGLGEIGIGME